MLALRLSLPKSSRPAPHEAFRRARSGIAIRIGCSAVLADEPRDLLKVPYFAALDQMSQALKIIVGLL
jgi:hypothetical protein